MYIYIYIYVYITRTAIACWPSSQCAATLSFSTRWCQTGGLMSGAICIHIYIYREREREREREMCVCISIYIPFSCMYFI